MERIPGDWTLKSIDVVDCAGKYGNKGCQGGSMDAAMTYVKTNGGLDTEEDYQYQGKNDQCDKSKEGQHAASITGHKDVPQNNPTQLAAAIAVVRSEMAMASESTVSIS